MKGVGYTLSNMDIVYYVDANYPHAVVDESGCWYAEENPHFKSKVGFRNPHQAAILFCSDQNFYPGLMAALFSVLDHHPDVPIVIVDHGLTPLQVRYLEQYAEVIPTSILLPPDPVWGSLNLSLVHYDRIVYLDCDVIVLCDISELLDTEAEFAAVRNLDWTVRENYRDSRILQKFKVDPDAPAFNAGVFSIDNRKWGNGRLIHEAMAVNYAAGWSFLYGDQSALQILMNANGQRVSFIPEKYNVIAEYWDREKHDCEARIVHYAGNEIKPWHPTCNYPKLDYFFRYSKIKKPAKQL